MLMIIFPINFIACCVFFCFFRSKLGLFQSRISLQKASVKVRGLTHKDTNTLLLLPLSRAVKETLSNKSKTVSEHEKSLIYST